MRRAEFRYSIKLVRESVFLGIKYLLTYTRNSVYSKYKEFVFPEIIVLV